MLFRALMTLVVAGGLSFGTASVTACGGSDAYLMPVNHPLVPFQKPDESELVEANVAPKPVDNRPPPDMGDDDDGAAKGNPCAAPPATKK